MDNREYLKEKVAEYRSKSDGKIHHPKILLRNFDYIYGYQENYNKNCFCYVNFNKEICISIDKDLSLELKTIYATILLARAIIYQKDEKVSKSHIITSLEDLKKDSQMCELCKEFAKDILLKQDNLLAERKSNHVR